VRKLEAKGVKFDGGWDMSAQYHDPKIREIYNSELTDPTAEPTGGV